MLELFQQVIAYFERVQTFGDTRVQLSSSNERTSLPVTVLILSQPL